MPRFLCLCVLAALVGGCGGPSSDTGEGPSVSHEDQATTSSNGPVPDIPRLSGPPRANKFLQLAVVAAGFYPTSLSAPPGLRYYSVGLRGIARSRSNDVAVDIHPFVFAQNDRGCISRAAADPSWLQNPFGSTAFFTAAKPTEGQLTFLVPDDSQRIRILIAPATGDGLIVPVGEEFSPTWPTPVQTIEDGSTLRVLVLPRPERLVTLPKPVAASEQVILDFVIENLKTTQGIEFTTSQQLRLIDSAGAFVQPSVLTQQLGCRLDDGDVVPPGHVRRFMVVYEMLVDAPLRLQYRGFETDEVSVDLE
jgi:hypothetical protein